MIDYPITGGIIFSAIPPPVSCTIRCRHHVFISSRIPRPRFFLHLEDIYVLWAKSRDEHVSRRFHPSFCILPLRVYNPCSKNISSTRNAILTCGEKPYLRIQYAYTQSYAFPGPRCTGIRVVRKHIISQIHSLMYLHYFPFTRPHLRAAGRPQFRFFIYKYCMSNASTRALFRP